MPANPNLARWTNSSAAYLLKEVATDASLPVLVEGVDERTDEFMQSVNRAEIRITGPMVREDSLGCYTVLLDANVLLTSRYGGDGANPYDILRYAGLFQQAMSSPIPVWNYGNQPGDWVDGDLSTQVFIGCLLPRHGKNDSVRVFNFGQTNETDMVKQTMVDARFVMHIND